MELPHLGVKCEAESCGQLDFLPVKCYGCNKKFCSIHWQYENHNCPAKHTKDVQVPVCPLCDKPVPTAKGVSPDTTVSAHIDRDCQSDPAVAKRNKVYTNRCTVKKCKQKEMMKVVCDQCRQSFCLKHRHPQDHDCQNKGPSSSPKATAAGSKAAQAALSRQEQSKNTSTFGSAMRSSASTTTSRLMGQNSIRSMFRNQQQSQATSTSNERMREDEAVARALQESLNEQQTARSTENTSRRENAIEAPKTIEEQDLMLAQALAESQREATSSRTSAGDGNKSCAIS